MCLIVVGNLDLKIPKSISIYDSDINRNWFGNLI